MIQVLELRNEEGGTPKTPKEWHKHLMTTAEVQSTMVSWIDAKLPYLYKHVSQNQGHMTKSNTPTGECVQLLWKRTPSLPPYPCKAKLPPKQKCPIRSKFPQTKTPQAPTQNQSSH